MNRTGPQSSFWLLSGRVEARLQSTEEDRLPVLLRGGWGWCSFCVLVGRSREVCDGGSGSGGLGVEEDRPPGPLVTGL